MRDLFVVLACSYTTTITRGTTSTTSNSTGIGNGITSASSSSTPSTSTTTITAATTTIAAIPTTTFGSSNTAVTKIAARKMTAVISSTTSTTSTLATAADIALHSVMESEQSVLRVLAAQSNTRKGSNTKSVIVQTPEAATAAMLLPGPVDGNFSSNVTLGVGGTHAKVMVPEAALEAIYQQVASMKNSSTDHIAGDAVLMLTALKDDVVETIQGVGPKHRGKGPNGGSASLVAPPVSVHVAMSGSGEAVHIENLPDAILVTVASGAWSRIGQYMNKQIRVASEQTPAFSCVFWYEEARFWSTSGVSTLYTEDDSIQCATSHLALFAVVFEEFGSSLSCPDVKLLSVGGLRNLRRGSWTTSIPALILWVLCGLLSLIVIKTAVIIDGILYRYYKWKERYFFVTTGTESLWNDEETTASRLLHQLHRKAEDVATMATSPADHIVARAFIYAMSAKVEIYEQEFRRLGQFLESTNFEVTSGSTKMDSKLEYIGQLRPKRYWYFFDRGTSFCKRLCIVFEAVQPWYTLTQFSFTPARVRAQLLACRLYGALCLAALFYGVSGIAVAFESEDVCTPAKDVWTIVRSLLVGLVSALMADWPVVVFAELHSRGFKFKSHWNEAVIKRTVWRWRVEDCLLWFVTICYNAFCVFFVCVFLANVSSDSYTDWMLSAVYAVAATLIINPLVYAFAIALLATIVVRMCPNAIKRNAPRSNVEIDIERSDAVANPQEVAQQDCEDVLGGESESARVIEASAEMEDETDSDSGVSSDSSVNRQQRPDWINEEVKEEEEVEDELEDLEEIIDREGEDEIMGQMLPSSCLTPYVTVPESAVDDTTQFPMSSLLPPTSLDSVSP